jgi:ApaG protein
MGMKIDMSMDTSGSDTSGHEGSSMYSEVTRAISVSVDPFYVEDQSEPAENRWVFGYRVVIENQGEGTVQLISRHWRITDGFGRLVEVKGEGVVGEQPMLDPGERFEYTSGTPLPTPSGIMTGTYQMVGEDGLWFDVEIPAFSLDAPGSRGTVN